MSRAHFIRMAILTTAIMLGLATEGITQGQPRMRKHTATQVGSLFPEPANKTLRGGEVSITTKGNTLLITGNGIPTHRVGSFPNRGNPHIITAQRYNFKATLNQSAGRARDLGLGQLFGVGVNGVPFDPGAAEYWQGNPQLGWQYEALSGAVPLGVDANFAHVQPSGAYHYHGLPTGLMQELGWRRSKASPLIGYAADGFPIYAIMASQGGRVVEMTSSYQLKSGTRPGGRGPDGRYDGAFVQDYQYLAGSGSLDECNGAQVTTAEHPNGTYAYFLTQDYPVVPRCLKGRADRSFTNRR